MKFLLFCFLFFPGLALPAQNIKGPQSKFDTPEIIDTITVAGLDTNSMEVAGDNLYIFRFTNVGNEPLILGQSNGSDPDFNCEWPHEPIKPGGHGEVVICAWRGRLRMDKIYRINDNSVTPQTIHIKRVLKQDSAYVQLQRRYAKRIGMKAKYGTTSITDLHEVPINFSNLPDSVSVHFRYFRGETISIDTSRIFYDIDSLHCMIFRDRSYVPGQAAFRYTHGKNVSYYTIDGKLLQTEVILSEKPLQENFRINGPGSYEYKVTVTPYMKGEKGHTYTETRKITKQPEGY